MCLTRKTWQKKKIRNILFDEEETKVSSGSGRIAGRGTKRSSRGNDGLQGFRHVRYGNESPIAGFR